MEEAVDGDIAMVGLAVFSCYMCLVLVALCMCCYLCHSRLRREARLERGYKKTCAVCLEDFKLMEEIGLCPCGHAFHRKCISKWLEIRNTCPMCNSQVKQQASERSTLVRTVDLPVTRV
uniref:RING-type domain-containing protein n=1 Tax=Branchiostoma floridae TaxID=7739 RepID=C3Y5S1_BRAFL|eukprot:XP_002608308.1 hypothetical protein BRAFLDRAFT_89285 [Branchiostoma floridae]